MNETTIPIEKAKDYILAGNAVIIFENTKTTNIFKFRIRQDAENKDLWWVNTLIKDIATGRPHLVGTIDRKYNKTTGQRDIYEFRSAHTYSPESQSYKDVFKSMWQRIVRGYWKGDEGNYINIMHDGLCLRCGRPLNDPISLRACFGPECRSILSIQT